MIILFDWAKGFRLLLLYRTLHEVLSIQSGRLVFQLKEVVVLRFLQAAFLIALLVHDVLLNERLPAVELRLDGETRRRLLNSAMVQQ